jgi:hypothetical protein
MGGSVSKGAFTDENARISQEAADAFATLPEDKLAELKANEKIWGPAQAAMANVIAAGASREEAVAEAQKILDTYLIFKDPRVGLTNQFGEPVEVPTSSLEIEPPRGALTKLVQQLQNAGLATADMFSDNPRYDYRHPAERTVLRDANDPNNVYYYEGYDPYDYLAQMLPRYKGRPDLSDEYIENVSRIPD